MGELPAGTVTFLFTDIEGSTRLWEEHPTAMQSALARHDAILSAAVDAHHGALVKKRGDGIHAVFPTAHDALAAAVAMQRNLAEEQFADIGTLRIRIGAHTCEAELRDGDYYGSGVNRAARLEGIAHGGQIVMSTVTADLSDGRFTLVDLGEHRLRDLTRAERVWQVDLDGERFPSLRSLDNLPGNLPVQLTEFVGRADDIAQVVEAIGIQRVVTLTGVGGVGKTRLALQVAADVADRFPHGTWFVDLAPVASADDVLPATATALGVDPAGDTEAALTAALVKQHRLLVIDNCEHVLEEAARMVETLVRSCPDVAVLATSREGLGAPGERILTVRSLGLPPVDAATTAVVETEAVRLFVDRARSVRADLPLDERTVAAIAEVCRRLDGIPLAIELAAARVQSMSAAEISERLDQRFRLLTRGSRAALGRQHTLQTTVDWSYQLLDEGERAVLTRASVFAGGFTLSAAEHVVTTDDGDRFAVLDRLDSLVRRSMLEAGEHDGVTRYRLLETIRQFAAERLEADGHADATRAAHLSWCRRFVGEASLGLHDADGPTWVPRLARELSNWRTAVAYAIETSDLDALAELFGSIPTLALYSTHAGSALAAAAASAFPIVTAGGMPDHAAAGALLALSGYEQFLRGNYDTAGEMLERACSLPGVGDLRAADLPWGFLYATTYFAQDFDAALEAADAHVRLGTERADRYLTTIGHGLRAHTLATLGRADEALAAEHIIAAMYDDSDLLLSMEACFMGGFTHAILEDDPVLATSLLSRAAALATSFGNPFFAAAALSYVARRTSEVTTTAHQLREALLLIRSLPQRDATNDLLEQVAYVLVRADRHETAAIIDGASHHLEWNQVFAAELREKRQALVDALGPSRLDELTARGRGLTLDEVLDLTITELNELLET